MNVCESFIKAEVEASVEEERCGSSSRGRHVPQDYFASLNTQHSCDACALSNPYVNHFLPPPPPLPPLKPPAH